jgi:O-antigen ligase/polysaccharide polymerase Wzy-like membrane protein
VLSLRRIDAAAFATAALATVLLASDQGAYFKRTWPWAGLGLAAAGILVLRGVRELRIRPAGLLLVASTAGIAAWTAVSWLWSTEPPATVDEALRAPIYLAAAVTFVALASAGGSLGVVLGVAAGTTAIAAYSLTHRQFVPTQSKLLAQPLGYANALGALCAIGLVIVATLGVRRRWIVAVAAAAVLVTALSLTSSRGSWLALAAGGLVAVGASRGWGGRAAMAVAAALAALFVLTVFTVPARLQARGDYWHIAWHVGFHHLFGGTGAGTYDLAWAAYGDLAKWGDVLDAHNLYLETFAELGLVGVVLVCCLAAPVIAALRGRASATTAAAIGGAVAYLVHAGLDWDWEMPAVTTVGIACIAATLSPAERQINVKRSRGTLLVLETGILVGYGLYLLGKGLT